MLVIPLSLLADKWLNKATGRYNLTTAAMTALPDIKPLRNERVYELLKRAGIRVPANRNQNFLSKCAFVQGKVVVLNFWWNVNIKPEGSSIVVCLKLPTKREEVSAREWTVYEAVNYAYENKLNIRVIILDGNPSNKGSKVHRRSLDGAKWTVTVLNPDSGYCKIVRGDDISNAADDLAFVPSGNKTPDRAKKLVSYILRDNRVRDFVIKRACGKCEYCSDWGFLMANGDHYLEAHHIIALSKEGRDTVGNVIALCPEHHRQAHFGKDAEALESQFIKILKRINRRK